MNNIEQYIMRQKLLQHIKLCLMISNNKVTTEYYHLILKEDKVYISLNDIVQYNELDNDQYTDQYLREIISEITFKATSYG